MAITNVSAARKAGFKLTNRAIKKAAAIGMSKIGTRTLHFALAPSAGHFGGTVSGPTADGVFSVVTYGDGGTGIVYTSLRLPSEWVAADVKVNLYWKSVAVTGDARFEVSIASKVVTETTVLADTQTVVTTVNATAGKLNKSQVTFTVAAALMTAGDWIGLLIKRDPTHGDDDLGEDVDLVAIDFEYTGRG